MIDLPTLIGWLLSGRGRLVCAAVLFLVVWGVKNVTWVKRTILTTKQRKRAAAVLLAAIPAAALSLATDESGELILITFLTAVFGSTGIHTLAKKKKKPDAKTAAEPDDDGGFAYSDEGAKVRAAACPMCLLDAELALDKAEQDAGIYVQPLSDGDEHKDGDK
jgi:hypothetical protein